MTEAAPPGPARPATELAPRPAGEVAGDRTATAPGPGSRSGSRSASGSDRPWPGPPNPPPGQPGSAPGQPGSAPGQPGSRPRWPAPGAESPAASAGLYRHGPGVPAAVPGQPVLSAEEVWRGGLPPGQSPGSGHGPGRGRRRRRAGSALTATLLIAVAVVVFARLHHAALRVTGVAITSQNRDGCSVDVTGRISTAGGAGTVSYQWVLTPPSGAPRPLSQTVTAGQPAIYVTAAIQGTGRLPRQVTLQVLSPGQGSATAHVDTNC